MLKSWHLGGVHIFGGTAHPESPMTGGAWMCPSHDTQSQCEAVLDNSVDLRRCIQVQTDPCEKSTSGGP
jgi:hypothetical protein